LNLVDSSGWLEYFSNGKNADIFARIVEDTENLVVSTINIYEVYKKILQQRDENSALQAIALMQQAKVIPVDSTLSLLAAKISIDLNIPMADSIILASAVSNNSTLWTQDSDFKDIPGVKYIKR
jgi:predicted nucleic acid-binding protein